MSFFICQEFKGSKLYTISTLLSILKNILLMGLEIPATSPQEALSLPCDPTLCSDVETKLGEWGI